MPNGHEEERNAVWSRSRFWGVAWDLAADLLGELTQGAFQR